MLQNILKAGSEVTDVTGGFLYNIFGSDKIIYVLIRMAVIVLITLFIAKVHRRISAATPKNKIHLRFIHNIITMLIYVVGFVWALNQHPKFTNGFETLLAGSGIVALTIGLAAQESLGNAINGMFISMFRPFEVGDRVRLINGNITGNIEDITLRHTVIRTFMNSRVIVPNSVINKDMIENSNFSENKASAFIDVTIPYDADVELAKSIIARLVEEHPHFMDTRGPGQQNQPKVMVYARNLGLYGLELRASMWTSDINNNFGACSDVRFLIKEEFDKAGIKIACSNNFDPYLTGPDPEG